ncbi:hypothetical protein Sjap_005153 [Stephania japonica]|uniref:Uncharacterized protein n=1 Tax=Stephania japonica TaxID=461633 RepID=A0AAP0K4J7_9MAGN
MQSSFVVLGLNGSLESLKSSLYFLGFHLKSQSMRMRTWQDMMTPKELDGRRLPEIGTSQ